MTRENCSLMLLIESISSLITTYPRFYYPSTKCQYHTTYRRISLWIYPPLIPKGIINQIRYWKDHLFHLFKALNRSPCRSNEGALGSMSLNLYSFLAEEPVVKKRGDLYWFCRDSCFLKNVLCDYSLGTTVLRKGPGAQG